MAAPFGPPPSLAMTCCLPSGMTRVSVWRAISTRITEPSGMATGPSGNFAPEVELPAKVVAARAVHRLLDAGERHRRPIGQPARQLGRRLHQIAILDYVPDQAPF